MRLRNGVVSPLQLGAVFLLLSTCSAGRAGGRRLQQKEVFATYTVPVGADITQIPGAAIINPKGQVNAISITLSPIVVQCPGEAPGSLLFKFTAFAYVDDTTQLANVFGPTMRLKRGTEYTIKLSNALIQPSQAEEVNWIHNYGNTNMHTHGLHAEPGVPSQSNASTYVLGDNPFFTIEARKNTQEPPGVRIFTLRIPSDHLPGMHWYHPHKHGSTALQVGTSHGVIIVEDDNEFWMPAPTNCQQFRSIIESADDVILDIQLYFFKTPTPKNVKPLPAYSKQVDNVNNGAYQYYSSISTPKNRYGVGKNKPTGTAVTANGGRGLNVLLVNGGYLPNLKLPTGAWQRWRFLYSGVKGFMIVTFIDVASNKTTNACEMLLYAKDGVYLQQVPRKVEGLFFAAANRAEVLVRCSGPVGTRYAATTRTCQPFSDDCFGYKGDQVPADRINHIGPLFQDVLFTVELTAQPPLPPGSPLLTPIVVEKACTPRRPSYATDLRDPALVAAGQKPEDVVSVGVGFGGINLPKSPEPYQAYFYACGLNNGSETAEGNRFEFPDPDPLTLELGKVVQWDFLDLDFHPMHVHINPYQIQTLNDTWLFKGSRWTPYFEAGDYHDTLNLPMIDLTAGVHVPLRFQPGKFPGYTLMHCHFLQHEDVGCMKVVWYKCPSLADDRQIGPCPNFTFPVPGSVPEALD